MHDQIKGVFLNRKLDFNRNTHKNTFNDLYTRKMFTDKFNVFVFFRIKTAAEQQGKQGLKRTSVQSLHNFVNLI